MHRMKNGVFSKNAVTADKIVKESADFIVSADILRFIVLLSIAILAPAINMQALTGTIVNATLFIAVTVIGVPGAILIGVIPSIISAVIGFLPAPILPMVPFIIASNALLAVTFAKLRERSYWKGVAVASILKFTFLSGISLLVTKLFMPAKIASQITLIMSWPQLFTALSGGILAYFVLGMMKRLDK